MLLPPQPRRRIAMSRRKYAALLQAMTEPADPHDIERFESQFTRWTPGCSVCATSSGSQALSLLLTHLGVQAGQQVLLPAYTDESVIGVLGRLQLQPVFVDIDPETHTIDLDLAAKRIGSDTRVLMVTHLFGNPADMDGAIKLAKQHNLLLIEDCAHAIGTMAEGNPVGTMGDGALFSFSSTKPFGTFGGGLAVTRHHDIGLKIRQEMLGKSVQPTKKLVSEVLFTELIDLVTHPLLFSGAPYGLLRLLDRLQVEPIDLYKHLHNNMPKHTDTQWSAFQARLAMRLLDFLPADIELRIRRGEEAIIVLGADRVIHSNRPGDKPVFYFLLVRSNNRRALARYLLKHGIDTGHSVMRHCATLWGDDKAYPETERAICETIQIPHHERLSNEAFARILEITRQGIEATD